MLSNNTQVLKQVNTKVVCFANTFVLGFDAMNLTYGQRLKAARKNKKLSQTELAEISGVGQGSISKIERGDQESSAYDVELSHHLGVNPMWLKTGDENLAPDWLATGKGEKSKSSRLSIESNAAPGPTLGEFTLVPVVGSAQLGDNGHWSELEYPVGHGDGYISYPTRDPNAYALRCYGDSMKPRIKEGEFVIVEPNTAPQNGDEVLVRTNDDRVMVKTLLYKREGRVHLLSINEAHPPQSIPLDEIEKIHPIAAIVKKALWVKDCD